MVVTSTMEITGFLVMIFSGFATLQQFGYLTAITMTAVPGDGRADAAGAGRALPAAGRAEASADRRGADRAAVVTDAA